MDFFKRGDPVQWYDDWGEYHIGTIATIYDPRWGGECKPMSMTVQGSYILVEQCYNAGLILAPLAVLKHLPTRND